MHNINKLSEKFYKEYQETKYKNNQFSKKDFRNDGVINFLMVFVFIMIIISITLTIIKDNIPLNYKVYGTFTLYVIGIIIAIALCIKDKIRFYTAQEIAGNFQNMYKEKFFELRMKAVNDAEDKIKAKNDMIKELASEYNIQIKKIDEEDLKKRIVYAENEVKKKEEELEKATFKYVLSNKSYNVRSRKDMVFDIAIRILCVYVFSFMLLSLPCIMTQDKNQNSHYGIIMLLFALIPAIIFGVLYSWGKVQDLKAFHIVNTCKLPNKPEYMESLELKFDMENSTKTYQNFVEIAYSFFQRIEE